MINNCTRRDCYFWHNDGNDMHYCNFINCQYIKIKDVKLSKFNDLNMNNLIEDIEKNAAKYDINKENLKERFVEVSNKSNDLYKLNSDSWKKYIDLSVECFKKHQELMDSLESVKPIILNKNENN